MCSKFRVRVLLIKAAAFLSVFILVISVMVAQADKQLYLAEKFLMCDDLMGKYAMMSTDTHGEAHHWLKSCFQ